MQKILEFLRHLIHNKYFKSILISLSFFAICSVFFSNWNWLLYKKSLQISKSGICNEEYRLKCKPIMLTEKSEPNDVDSKKNKCEECFDYEGDQKGNILDIALKDKFNTGQWRDVIDYEETYKRSIILFWDGFISCIQCSALLIIIFGAIYFRRILKQSLLNLGNLLWNKEILLRIALMLLIIYLFISLLKMALHFNK